MKIVIPKGSTSRILTVFIQDSSSTTGAGLGSLTNASSIVGGYVREGGTGVALAVDEDVTTEGTYQAPSAAGKVRIGTPANMRTGTYELHFHNNLWATGAETITITLGGATNMAPLNIEVQLSDPNRGLGGPLALPDALPTDVGGVRDVHRISGDSTAADNAEAFFDGTGYAGTGNVIPTVTTLTGHTPQTGDSYAIVNSGTHGNAALKTLIDAVDNFIDTEIASIISTLGTPAGASLAADLVVIDNFVDDLEGRLTSARAGYLDNINNLNLATVPAFPSNFASLGISAGGVVNADAVAISGDTAAADQLEREYDGTGAGELLIRTTIATRASNNDFTLTAGSADNSAYLYHKVILRDQSTTTQLQVGFCSVYTGSTKRVQLIVDPGIFTTAVGDIVEIYATEVYNTWNASLDRQLNSTGNEAIATAVLAATNGSASVATQLARLDTTVGSRASQTSVDTVDDFLDTEMAATLAAVDTEVAAIQTAVVTTIPATLSGLFTTALTEAYRADGATGSVAQILYELLGHHNESTISSTTKTVKKIDGSTTALTLTLNSATTPTSVTRAT